MRHLPFPRASLLAAIRAFSPTWLELAEREADIDREADRHVPRTKGHWSKIKQVFQEHQRQKCAFCERTLGESGVEWDVEHFRPKGRVDEWHSATRPDMATGGADERGYFRLAFEPRNYLASCKTCNSAYKRNYFPVAGERALSADTLEDAATEGALLLNPLNPNDPAPESLIEFYGVNPRIVAATETDRERATATIEVLGLAEREELDRARAETIMALRAAMDKLQDRNEGERDYGKLMIEAMTQKGSRMSSCALAYKRLYLERPDEARELARLATRYVQSHSR